MNILAIDVGSSSVRATVYDEVGRRLEATQQLRYRPKLTSDGGAEVDPDDLLGLVVRAVDRTLDSVGDRSNQIAAVATSEFWHGILGLDREGRPTTPLLTWADRRSAGEARELRQRLDVTTVHRRTGCVPHSSYWPAKLLWLSRAHPTAFSRTVRWASFGEYLQLELFGEARASPSMASATGLLDQHEDRWDTDMLGKLPIAVTALPAVGTEPLRGLKGAWARKWPALASVPWYPPVGDGACSNVGSGCVGRNRPALMVGTSGAMRVLLDGAPIYPPAELWRYRLDAARYVVGGALSEGGNVVAWLRKILRLPAQSETERALSTIGRPVGGERLDFLPILAGERSPGWSDGANGMIVGLTTTTEPLDILKAAMEGVALRFAAIAEPLDTALPGDKLVVATGGALLSSPAWVQIMADVLGKPLALSPVEEASSRGAALLAIERLGGLRIEKESGPDEEIFKPDPDRHRVYRLALDRQQVLYDLANRAWHNLPRASALAHEADERLRGGADEC